MSTEQEAVAQLIVRALRDLRSIRNMLEVLVWAALAIVVLLTAIALFLLP